MNKETAFFLWKKIETVKDIDLGSASDCLGSFICVQVEVDVSQPLEREFLVDLDGTKSVMIYMMYERLPNYCWDCGSFGHTKKECPVEETNRDYDPNNEAKYTNWLKSPLPTRIKRGQSQTKPSRDPKTPAQEVNT